MVNKDNFIIKKFEFGCKNPWKYHGVAILDQDKLRNFVYNILLDRGLDDETAQETTDTFIREFAEYLHKADYASGAVDYSVTFQGGGEYVHFVFANDQDYLDVYMPETQDILLNDVQEKLEKEVVYQIHEIVKDEGRY